MIGTPGIHLSSARNSCVADFCYFLFQFRVSRYTEREREKERERESLAETSCAFSRPFAERIVARIR